MLLAVPNFSEGRDARVIDTIGTALAVEAAMLDLHSDATHDRCVFTLAGEAGVLSRALIAGAGAAVEAIDMREAVGAHPCIGALDVAPLVYLDHDRREAAREGALATAEGIAGLGVPTLLYGELATSEERRERAFFRRGGPAELARRMRAGELGPDFGPPAPHPTAGATLVTARAPLAAFNVILDTSDMEVGRAVAAELRESGGGLAGVRALAIEMPGRRVQVSTNVHDLNAVPLRTLVEEVRRLAGLHAVKPVEAELVGLIPEAAVEGYPGDVPIAGFDPELHVIERRLAGLG
jgi:glutamate formiminotransferase/glutamate formiminotransferase/formiminotetrahydrofolate cyclodeaminase